MRAVVAWALVLASCSTTPLPPRVTRADVGAGDAGGTLYRWARGHDASRVLVVPEVGYDERLVAPLCERLRDAGYDVYALEARRAAGVEDLVLGVVDALRVSGADYLLAMGVAGAFAVRATDAAAVRGALLVNVPFAFEPSNVVLADALVAHGFDPAAWARTPAGPMLLGAGRSTRSQAALVLEKLAFPPAETLRRDIEALFSRNVSFPPPTAALSLLVGVKDNLVEPRFALSVRGEASANVVAARRMGLIEGFGRDVGHLDWLVDDAVLDDVMPAILEALEALP